MQLTKHWAAQLDDYVIDLAWSPDGAHLAGAASAAGPITLFGPDGAGGHELPGHEAARTRSPGSRDAGPGQRRPGRRRQALGRRGRPARRHGRARALLGRAPGLAAAGAGAPRSSPPRPGRSSPSSIRRRVRAPRKFKDAPKTITALAWTRRAGCVAAACFGGVCLWDADAGGAQREFPYGNGIQALAWSPDGRWLVSGNQDPSVHLWMPESDVELQMSGYEGKVRHLSFDRTSRWLATSGSRDACVWDCSGAGPEGREPAMLPTRRRSARSRSSGPTACSPRRPRTAPHALEPRAKAALRATVRCRRRTRLAWSPDDRLLAIGSEKGSCTSCAASHEPSPSWGLPGPLWQALGLTVELAP
jgi:hypothetical protein